MATRQYVKYALLMELLGLSQHPHQTARRVAKYPQHFISAHGQYFVSLAYARFLVDCQLNAEQALQLQKGGANG